MSDAKELARYRREEKLLCPPGMGFVEYIAHLNNEIGDLNVKLVDANEPLLEDHLTGREPGKPAMKAAARIWELWMSDESKGYSEEDKIKLAAVIIESRCGECPDE